MRIITIAICEQTHPECRGYACDDHVNKECYTVILSPEYEEAILKEIARIESESERTLSNLMSIWQENNPDDECLCEGEEFVGHVWIETQGILEVKTPESYYKTSGEMLEILKQVQA